MNPPFLTIIVIFYNNKREASRTLYSLSSDYQKNINGISYNVLAIDNASPKPIEAKMVKQYGENFDYLYFETDLPSPCAALNEGIRRANTPYVMCIIDGAHIVTPGLIYHTHNALKVFPGAIVYTLPFHLGEILQNDAMLEGYNQKVEDKLLESIPWKENGYSLFSISEIRNANHSFFSTVIESNCFAVSKKTMLEKGGFDEKFVSRGGGLANLDIFKRLVEDPDIQPVALVGEASFHQFHGGVSTNVKRVLHPISEYREEYRTLRGVNFNKPFYAPYFWGHFPETALKYMPDSPYKDSIMLAKRLLRQDKVQSAIDVLELMKPINVYNLHLHKALGMAYLRNKDFDKAQTTYERVMELAPYDIESYLHLADIFSEKKQYQKALNTLEKATEVDEHPRIFMKMSDVYLAQNKMPKALNFLQEAIDLMEKMPTYPSSIYIDIAKTYEELKKLHKAINILTMGLQNLPENALLHINAGRIYNKRNDFEKAEYHFQQAIRYYTANPSMVYLALSNCYIKQGKKEAANEELKKALAADPYNERIVKLVKKMKS